MSSCVHSFDPRIRVFPNGTLTVQAVTDRDAGDYLCVARNKMGDDFIQLRVNVVTRPAKIQSRPLQEVVYGGGLILDCVASGIPDPKISWALPDGTMVVPGLTKDGAGLGQARRYEVKSHKLIQQPSSKNHNHGCHFQVCGL